MARQRLRMINLKTAIQSFFKVNEEYSWTFYILFLISVKDP